MTDAAYQAKRQEIIANFTEGMLTLSDRDIATRAVSMLIHDEGNLNRYQETLEIVLAAHSLARRDPRSVDGSGT